MLSCVTSVDVAKYLMNKVVKHEGRCIFYLSLTFTVDGQFSDDLYRYFTSDEFISIVIKLGMFRKMTATKDIYQTALDQMLLTDTNIAKYTHNDDGLQTVNNHVINILHDERLLIKSELVGPINLKYITNYSNIGRNPH